ncbi:hypothetical protein HMPREF0654_07850 [Prevotella disiens DNF00882]|uniref:DUF551 domain-containing protein n=2 Tax=Prevotella disiens TaxID=28130 RepID=A0A096ANX0_9BACT|nr:hypothetical protein HMPREF0654_07850 [Prevotella disiens DNF00882]
MLRARITYHRRRLLGQRQSDGQWHDVKEELPPIETMVIIRTKNGNYGSSMVYNSIDSLGNELGQQWRGSTNFVRSITHWCEIPQFKEE